MTTPETTSPAVPAAAEPASDPWRPRGRAVPRAPRAVRALLPGPSPERVSDVPADIAMMSDIRVARTLVGPPFPVSPLASKRWLVRERAFVTALFAAYAEGTFRPAACYPFTVLRERLPDSTEEYVGQVTVMYAGDGETRRTPVNETWEEWRTRTKVFEIGAALRPEWHRKGLATAAVRVAMHDWAIPQMGCTELRAECLASNIGSVKIWQKYGFVEDPEFRTEVQIFEAKGAGSSRAAC
ncbi:N-acetyltransferase domain-containing protein [Mycena venus]|uniref:N-acetyltransferase domain-containing protein n=1 Tax=Mycena venus TaxID=2733690 RepID=A0A8H6XVG1_9AGAR|nr:N-acetyltransferase domain-containing protein [Mycena venus]